jgi:hypothetical protein
MRMHRALCEMRDINDEIKRRVGRSRTELQIRGLDLSGWWSLSAGEACAYRSPRRGANAYPPLAMVTVARSFSE